MSGILCVPPGLQAQNLLHIRVLEGEGLIRPAGAKDPRGVTVQITDETGKPVESATVSFRLPEEGPGGVFARGLKTEIITTAADGRAPVYGMTWNQQPGPFQIRVTALKGQVRAGTVISEYISTAPAAGKNIRAKGTSRKKWLIIAALAGGGAAAAAVALGSKGGSSASSPGGGPPPQIGLPTITIGSGN